MLYAVGLGLIMLVSLAVSNISALAFSNYVDFEYRRQVCAGMFISGMLLGMWGAQRHLLRAKQPWKVSQSQVALPFVGFFLLTLTAILIAR